MYNNRKKFMFCSITMEIITSISSLVSIFSIYFYSHCCFWSNTSLKKDEILDK